MKITFDVWIQGSLYVIFFPKKGLSLFTLFWMIANVNKYWNIATDNQENVLCACL